MKLHQLISICRDCPGAITDAVRDPDWNQYASLVSDIDGLVRSQNRQRLDEQLPNELIEAVLSRNPIFLYHSIGHLRSRPLRPGDRGLPILDAYKQFGADKVDEALEYGLVEI